MYRIVVFVGSLRKQSINLQLARALEKLAAGQATFEYARIDDLPLYNQDNDGDFPAQGVRLKNHVRGADAVLFVTPEYNRSIPGVLKNAIDTASRPYGDGAFDGKPAAVIGASPGAPGAAMAQQHLRNVLVFVNLAVMAQPEAFLQFKEGLIEADGSISNEGTRKFLQGFVDAFIRWIGKHHG
ncbi:NADPH-dependent FMN reductase [Stenotrophomonas sp. YIM B06876]|uniref:NADPH-dependent FMN reductase n=1 Tax=Stenotrophomonas sp. YIM B06876 TaxID=3060211 RepID=UPI002739CDD3|nr:NADPH-dependent FMN reductase [Stenotrophomonas sp. YIM B06876]